jgi:hypothetical protein
MSVGEHDRIEELMSIRSLGGLDPADDALLDRLVTEHGPGCEECGVLRDEYAEVAGRLAFALAPAEPREGLEDELLALATGAAATNAVGAASRGAPVARSLDDRREERPARENDRRPWRALVAAAADPSVGDLAIAYRPGSDGALLLGSGLPSPGPDRVLEVWMIRGDRVTRGACVRPAADGSLAKLLDAGLGSTTSMAVTVERDSCPSAPTTDPILTADLPPAA